MLNFVLNLVLSALVLLITAQIVSGFELDNFFAAILATLLIGVMNFLIRPLLMLFTLPINILTLGLFSFVINALLLMITSALVDGFEIAGWKSAILGAIVLSLVQIVINTITPGKRKLFG